MIIKSIRKPVAWKNFSTTQQRTFIIHSVLNMWFVGWIRNAIQHLCAYKQGFVGWRCAYPSYKNIIATAITTTISTATTAKIQAAI